MRSLIVVIIVIFSAVYFYGLGDSPGLTAPYPASTLIRNVAFSWSSFERRAPGSDNWPVTWADDGHQYTSWGDGGGFGGTNGRGRVSLGFARIEGGHHYNAGSLSIGQKKEFRGVNIFGGHNSKNPATIKGKSYGIVSAGGELYAWISPGSGNTGYNEARLYKSADHAASWTPANWAFSKDERFIFPAFLQFGKDYADAADRYLYIYSIILHDDTNLLVQKPGQIALLRVPVEDAMDRNSYETFAGLDQHNSPIWTDKLEDRVPVFNDPNGVGWNVSVSFNKGLGRYLLTTEHKRTTRGYIGIFESEYPWGPWYTAHYGSLKYNTEMTTFYYNFPNKWLSQDGKDFVMIFTGTGEYDAYNSVSGKFLTRAD